MRIVVSWAARCAMLGFNIFGCGADYTFIMTVNAFSPCWTFVSYSLGDASSTRIAVFCAHFELAVPFKVVALWTVWRAAMQAAV